MVGWYFALSKFSGQFFSVMNNTDKRLCLLLFCLLLGTYLLIYVPTLDSIDAEAILAVSTSLVRHGSFEIGAIGADDALLPYDKARMGRFGLDGNYYSKKGVVPSLALLPLVVLSEWLPWLDTRATAMLFNPIVTAATAILLYIFSRQLGYRLRTALATSFIYGVASLPIIYTQTLYGEPLAALLLLGAVVALHEFHQATNSRSLLIVGICLGLLIGVNAVYGLIFVFMSIYVLWYSIRLTRDERPNVSGQKREKLAITSQILAFYFMPVLACLIAIGLYNLVRFGSALTTGYGFGVGEGFTTPLLKGLIGLSISPFRGLAWLSPVLLIAIPGWLMFRRRNRGLAWMTLGLVVIQWLAFAAWSSWDGGVVWGPRFLIPIIPLLTIYLLPLVEAAWEKRSIAATMIFFCLISFTIQMIGVLFDYVPVYDKVFTEYYDPAADTLRDSVVLNLDASPILGNIELILNGAVPRPAWLARGIDGIQLLATVGIITVGLFLGMQRQLRPRAGSIFVVVIMLICVNIVVARQQVGGASPIQKLSDALQPPGTVIAATTSFGQTLLDLKGQQRVFSTNAPTRPDDRLASQMWQAALKQAGNLWLVTWFPPADTANWQECDLFAHFAFAYERGAADHRALLFHSVSDEMLISQPRGDHFGAITLQDYATASVPDGLVVQLNWSTSTNIPENDTWFVHVLDSNGNILAQQDRQPQGGYEPTSEWSVGDTVTDRLYFPAIIQWSAVRIGWVNPNSGERLATVNADGTATPDGFVIIPQN
jgi:hypothetical protein